MREHKHCPTCSLQKPATEFHCDRARSDGLASQCKVCKRAVQKRWYLKNRARHVANVNQRQRATEAEIIKRIIAHLRDHPCVDCGETNPVLLEFDHVRGHKVNSVCNLMRRGSSWKKIQVEIQKCDVRCCRCHRLKTAQQFGYRKLLFAFAT